MTLNTLKILNVLSISPTDTCCIELTIELTVGDNKPTRLCFTHEAFKQVSKAVRSHPGNLPLDLLGKLIPMEITNAETIELPRVVGVESPVVFHKESYILLVENEDHTKIALRFSNPVVFENMKNLFTTP